jgi:hypothetical protein
MAAQRESRCKDTPCSRSLNLARPRRSRADLETTTATVRRAPPEDPERRLRLARSRPIGAEPVWSPHRTCREQGAMPKPGPRAENRVA